MQKHRNLKANKFRVLTKLIAIILIATFLLPQLLLTAYAVQEAVGEKRTNIKTNNKYVDFNIKFTQKGLEAESIRSDINDKDLKLKMYLHIKDSGYMKDAKVNIKNTDALSLQFREPEVKPDLIQKVTATSIFLNQIKGESESYIEIPVEYAGIDNLTQEILNNKLQIEFTAKHVNAKGLESKVQKNINLKLAWVDSKEIKINNVVQKYIPFKLAKENNIVLQNLIKITNTKKEQNLPVEKIEIQQSVAEIFSKAPDSVNVSIQRAGIFNKEENIKLEEKFWNYDKENKLINIAIENIKNPDGTYTYNEGNLEVLVTSIYNDVKNIGKADIEMKTKVSEKVVTGVNSNETIKAEADHKFSLNKQLGKLIDINEEKYEEKFPKGILYVNEKATEVINNEIKTKLKLDVSSTDLVDRIKVVSNTAMFKYKRNGQNAYAEDKNLKYKSIEINKVNFDSILGKNGTIEIKSKGKLIGRIDQGTQVKNQKYTFVFNQDHSEIEIETTKPISEGELFIEETRMLAKTSYNREDIKKFESIMLNKKAYIVLNNKEKLLKNLNTEIDLIEGVTNATIRVNKSELSTIEPNLNVEYVIELNNDKKTSDIYGRSVFEIVMPKGTTNIKVKDLNIVNGNGLKIEKAFSERKNGITTIKVFVNGMQNGLSKSYLTNGTNIILNTDITLDRWLQSQDAMYSLKYSNAMSSSYPKKYQWSMSDTFSNMKRYGNGIMTGTLKYNAPKGVVIADNFKNINSKNDSVLSIQQGYKEGKIDVFKDPKIIDSEIIIFNNYKHEVLNPRILGRIPGTENTNIITNKSLENKFDTKLEALLKTDSKAKYEIYYSKNPNANNNLEDKTNGWEKSLPLASIKSYLIVFKEALKPAERINFSYKLRIPGELEYNLTTKTFSIVQYAINDPSKGVSEYYQIASQIGLTTGEGVSLKVNVDSNKDRIFYNEDIIYTVKVVNDSTNTIAKNTNTFVKIPEQLKYKGIEDSSKNHHNIKEAKGGKGIYINWGNIKAGEEKSQRIMFTSKVNKEASIIKLETNTKAENFEKIVSVQSKGEAIAEKEMTVELLDTSPQNEGDKSNIYPGYTKGYILEIKNNTEINYKNDSMPGMKLENIEVKVNIPPQLEYVDEGIKAEVLIYTVKSYDRANNVLTLLLKDSLTARESAKLRIPLKVKDNDDKTDVVEIKANVTATLENGQKISVASNTVTNFIARVVLKTTTKIVTAGSKGSGSIEEYEPFEIRQTIEPKSHGHVIYKNLVLEAGEGIIIRNIYLNPTPGDEEVRIGRGPTKVGDSPKMKSAATLGGLDPKYPHEKSFKYPCHIAKGGKLEVIVFAEAGCIGQASTQSVSVKIGLEGEEESKGITVVKSKGQNKLRSEDASGETVLVNPAKVDWGIGSGGVGKAVGNSLVGKAWLDKIGTGIYDKDDKVLSDVVVKLVDNDTRKIVGRSITKENGNYQFDNVVNGNYSVMFEYDNNKYAPTIYNRNVKLEDEQTKSQGFKINKSVAVTAGINVNFASVRNIDIGLVENTDFDLSLDHEIAKIEIMTQDKKAKEINMVGKKNSKIELNKADLGKTTVRYTYNVQVANEGKIVGNVLKVVADIPEGLRIVNNENEVWKKDAMGTVYTTVFSSVDLNPGDKKQVKLVLEKDIKEEDLGLHIVNFEIKEASNALGVEDRDSTPGNKNTSEDDFTTSEIVIGLNTGKKIAYAILSVTLITIISVMIYLVVNRHNNKLIAKKND